MNDNIKLEEAIENYDNILKQLNKQINLCFVSSAIVFSGIIILVFLWDQIYLQTLWWTLIGIILLISVNMWFYTVNIMTKLIAQQKIQLCLLTDIIQDIQLVKVDLIQHTIVHEYVENDISKYGRRKTD